MSSVLRQSHPSFIFHSQAISSGQWLRPTPYDYQVTLSLSWTFGFFCFVFPFKEFTWLASFNGDTPCFISFSVVYLQVQCIQRTRKAWEAETTFQCSEFWLVKWWPWVGRCRGVKVAFPRLRSGLLRARCRRTYLGVDWPASISFNFLSAPSAHRLLPCW